MAQEALIILRSSFSTRRLMHVLWCSPFFEHPLLQEHDTVLRESLTAIVNIHMSYTKWLQANIPWRAVSLEFGMPHDWYYPPFCHLLWSRTILNPPFCHVEYKMSTKKLKDGSVPLVFSHYHSTTSDPFQAFQRSWDALVVVWDLQTLVDNATSDINRARLFAVKADQR